MKQNWFERLANAFGGGQQGAKRAAGSSKHERGKYKPRRWHAKLRLSRKRQKLARRAQRAWRGKRGKRGN